MRKYFLRKERLIESFYIWGSEAHVRLVEVETRNSIYYKVEYAWWNETEIFDNIKDAVDLIESMLSWSHPNYAGQVARLDELRR